MQLFGTSGIRRIADASLLEIALKVGLALGKTHGNVIVGRDTRTSGEALKHALIAGVISAGGRCHDAGIVPTPTLAYAARNFKVGVMITASHNPPKYNGIKIFNPDGSSFVSKQQEEMELLLSRPLSTATWEDMQEESPPYSDAINDHVSHIVEALSVAKRTRMVVDCTCGAASVITPLLLRKMGADVVGLNTHPSGFFPHDAEPTEENLTDLMRICRELGAVGIAHDGDADRMMAVDERGRFVPGDKLLVLLAQHIGSREVVTTVDASMAIEEQGLHTIRTKVGDTYVSERLRSWGDFGGEPSGAWVFPKNSLCPDGIYAAALLASIASRKSLASLADSIAQYPIIRGSVPSNGAAPDMDQMKIRLKARQVDSTDGNKYIFDDGWVLVRPSGTEPKIRITAEGRTEARARELYDMAVKSMNVGPSSGGQKA